MMKPTQILGMTAAFSALLIFAATEVDAQRGGRGGGGASRASTGGGGGGGANRSVRASSGSSISTASRGNANVNRGNATRSANNVNRSGNRVNTGNINTGDVNVNVDNNCCNGGWGYGAHPVARGAAIATTAAVMGSYYSALPGGCVTVVRIGINYSRCGSVWYQPIYSGANVQYQVVAEP
jgi:hypothetical protein